jgi:hypothetical protein
MIYLSGTVRSELVGLRPDLGFLKTPQMGNTFDFDAGPWAADNGCFTLGARFDLRQYLRFLAGRRRHTHTCRFAPAPDVVGDAAATLIRSAPVLARIREYGFPAALVAQDGLTDPPWDDFDCLFIGGTTEFKLSHRARELTEAAQVRGKWVHMGRVNSETRLRTAAMWGCDSADGTFLKFAPDTNIPRLLRWLDSLNRQPMLAPA